MMPLKFQPVVYIRRNTVDDSTGRPTEILRHGKQTRFKPCPQCVKCVFSLRQRRISAHLLHGRHAAEPRTERNVWFSHFVWSLPAANRVGRYSSCLF